jgi:hypothetical protein
MTYPPQRQLKSDLSRLELILMMAVAASNPSATSTPRKQAFKQAFKQALHVQYAGRRYAKPPIYKVANMQAARQLFET